MEKSVADQRPKTAHNDTHTQPHQTEILPDFTQFSDRTLLYLQRTIGNHATQKYLRQSPSGEVVQRAETGLRNTTATTNVAAGGHGYATDPANADEDPATMIPPVMNTINAELKAIGVPPTTVAQNNADGNLGTFSFQTWVINMDPVAAFNGKTKISELTEAEIANFVNTLHHEARHCEQWFRMARLRAGQIIGVPTSLIGGIISVPLAAVKIADEMQIPTEIAVQAAMQPLYNTGSKESAEAQAWYDSVYGANAAYRNLILGSLRNAVDPLRGQFDNLREAIYLKSEATTPFDRNDAQLQVDSHIGTIENQLEDVYTVRDGPLAAEYARLAGKGALNPIETTMFGHTGNLINIIDQIRAMTLSESNAYTMDVLRYQLSTERHAAYHALPEETDAHATGDAASLVYGAAASPAP